MHNMYWRYAWISCRFIQQTVFLSRPYLLTRHSLNSSRPSPYPPWPPLTSPYLTSPYLTATWSVRVTFGGCDNRVPLSFYFVSTFSSLLFPWLFTNCVSRLAYLNNARQVATPLLGLYFVWLRILPPFGSPLVTSCPWLWLTMRFYIEFKLSPQTPSKPVTLRVAVIKCAD